MRKTLTTLLIFAFIGWAICGAIMGFGPLVFSMQTTLYIHLIGGPLCFGILSFVYHKKFNYTKPMVTTLFFIGFVVIVDFVLVATIIMKNYEMFYSPLGTWIPFSLIIISTYIIGALVNKKKR